LASALLQGDAMENHPILRSLVADGRPLGTERPATSSSRTDPDQQRFDERLERARLERDDAAPRTERERTRAVEPRQREQRSEAEPREAHERGTRPQTVEDAQSTQPQDRPGAAEPSATAENDARATGSAAHSEPEAAPASTEAPGAQSTDASSELAPATSARDVAGALASEPATPQATPNAADKLNVLGATQPAPAKPLPTMAGAGPSDAAGVQTTLGESALASKTVANAAAPRASEPSDVKASAATATSATQTAEVAAAPLRELDERLPETARTSATSEAPRAPVDNDRAAQILRHIRLHLAPELRQATIQLEPRELGRITIRVALRGDALHAQMHVEKSETLEALERQVPELRAALERSGLGGGQLNLQLGLSERGSEQRPQRSARRLARHDDLAAPVAPRALVQSLSERLRDEHGVDTYA
jgi:flagellar hook-length control protein FliK